MSIRIELWAEDVPGLKVGDDYEGTVTGRVVKITESLADDVGSVATKVELSVSRICVNGGPEIKPWYLS